MPAIAINRSVRMSPRKIGDVATLVRGRTVKDALTILEHTPRRAALPVKETIKSAKSNAEHNHNYKSDGLFISEIVVTPGPRFRRWRPAARGRALPFERKTSHIRVVIDGVKREAKKPTPVNTNAKEAK